MKRLFFVATILGLALAATSAAFAQENELVGTLTKNLGVTKAQAEGGTGALLALAKSKLSVNDFSKVSSAVPGTDALLKSAPAVDSSGLAGLASKAGGLASLASSFNNLGLNPGDAARFAPEILKFLNNKGAAEAAKLLAGVWK
ncbi:MAG TPA: DUF2780 domain-containing protein [Methylomirabilota bacterium]|jgi:hypothetical protein|nr:DUF2780 domain-containing protein [Methylomirabilota bacterium]